MMTALLTAQLTPRAASVHPKEQAERTCHAAGHLWEIAPPEAWARFGMNVEIHRDLIQAPQVICEHQGSLIGCALSALWGLRQTQWTKPEEPDATERIWKQLSTDQRWIVSAVLGHVQVLDQNLKAAVVS
jgi:hypothetical protein